MNIDIKKEDIENGVDLFVTGYIDSINSFKFQDALNDAISEGKKNIIVDMSKVEYICSIGLRILLKAYKDSTEAGCRLSVGHPSENVKKVLVITSSADLLIV